MFSQQISSWFERWRRLGHKIGFHSKSFQAQAGPCIRAIGGFAYGGQAAGNGRKKENFRAFRTGRNPQARQFTQQKWPVQQHLLVWNQVRFQLFDKPFCCARHWSMQPRPNLRSL